MKTCRTCKKELPLSAFPKDASKKDGHGTQCKACRSAERKAKRAEAKAAKPPKPPKPPKLPKPPKPPKLPKPSKPLYTLQCHACGVMHETTRPKATRCSVCVENKAPTRYSFCWGAKKRFPDFDQDKVYSPAYAEAHGLSQYTLTEVHRDEKAQEEKIARWKSQVEAFDEDLTKNHGKLKDYKPDYGDTLAVLDPDAPRETLWDTLGLNPPEVRTEFDAERIALYPRVTDALTSNNDQN